MKLSGIFSQNGKDVKLSGFQDHLKVSQVIVSKPKSPLSAQQTSLIQNFSFVQNMSDKKSIDNFNHRKNNNSILRQRQNMKKSTSLQLKLQTGSYLFLPEQAFDLQSAKIPQTTRNFHSQDLNLFNSTVQSSITATNNNNINNYAFYKYDPNLPLQQVSNPIQSPNNNQQGFFQQKPSNQKNDNNFLNNLLEKEKSPTYKRNRNLSDFTSSSNQKQPSSIKLRSKHFQQSLDKQEHQNGQQNLEIINQLTPIKQNKFLIKKETSQINHKILSDLKEQVQNQGQILPQNNFSTLSQTKYPLRSNYIIKQKNGQTLTKSQSYQIQQLTSTFQPMNQKKLTKGEFVTLFSKKMQQINVQQPKSIIKLNNGSNQQEQNQVNLNNNFDTKQINLQKRNNSQKQFDNREKNNIQPIAQREEFKFDQKPEQISFFTRKRALSNLGIQVTQKQEKDVQTDLQDFNFQAQHPYASIVYKKVEQNPIINVIQAQQDELSKDSNDKPNLQVVGVENINFQQLQCNSKEQIPYQYLNDCRIKMTDVKIQKMLSIPHSQDLNQIQQNHIDSDEASKMGMLKSSINFYNLQNSNIISKSNVRNNKFQNYENDNQQKEDSNIPRNNELYLISKYTNSNKDSPHYFHQMSKISYSNSQQNLNKDEKLNKTNLNNSIYKPQLSHKQIVITQQAQLDNDKGKNKQYLQSINDLNQNNTQQEQQQKPNSQIFKDINVFYKQFKFSSIYENYSQNTQLLQTPKNNLKNSMINQDSSSDSIQNIYLQKFDGYRMQSHYQLYQNQTQTKKRGSSFFTKTSQDIYQVKAPKQIQNEGKIKESSLTLKNEPPALKKKKSQQNQSASKQVDKALEEKDVFNESVQPWSRKDSELDISIF